MDTHAFHATPFQSASPLPFPLEQRLGAFSARPRRAPAGGAGGVRGRRPAPDCTDSVIASFATVSRRITDLARELKCLGYFNEDDDTPRAA